MGPTVSMDMKRPKCVDDGEKERCGYCTAVTSARAEKIMPVDSGMWYVYARVGY